jgi:exonuclease VII large subunit
MRIYRKHRIRNEKNAHEGANSLAGLIGNYSQLALFLLAVFGYFYTVQPIYQNQKLSEENSKLLNENEKLQSNSEKLKANFEKDLQEYKIQIATLADKYEQKELEYKEMKDRLDSASKAETEVANKLMETTKLQIRNNTLYELGEEINDNCSSRMEKYFNTKNSDNFFDTIEKMDRAKVNEYIDTIYSNPIDDLYPVIIKMIDKYKYMQDEASKIKNEALLKLESEARENRIKYSLPSDKITNIKILSRTFNERYVAIENKFILLRNYEEEATISQNFINDIFAYEKNIPDTSNTLAALMGNALNFSGYTFVKLPKF